MLMLMCDGDEVKVCVANNTGTSAITKQLCTWAADPQVLTCTDEGKCKGLVALNVQLVQRLR